MPNGRSSSAPGPASRRRSRRSPTTSPTTITTSTTASAPACSRSTNCSTCRWWRAPGRRCARAIPDVAEARLVPELVRDLIGAMVNDVLAETRRGARRASDRPRRSAPPAARSPAFPTAMAAEEAALKAFLHARMYEAPPVQAVRAEAQRDPRRPVRRLSRRSRAGSRRNGARAATDPTRVAARDRRLHRRHDRPLCGRAATRSWSGRAGCRKASEA